MFTPARKSMPALDYVSIVRSVYADRHALLFGALASAVAAATTAYRNQSLALYAVAAAFVIVGLIRYINMVAFWRAPIAFDDADGAEYWEGRATLGGALVAGTYGAWCFVGLVFVNDGYTELASISLGIAAMVGVVARNFGLDRLVTIQTLLLCVPLAVGFFLGGEIYHSVLALLLVLMLISFRKLAGDIRAILLSAVHGREEASRLAEELDTALDTMQHGLCMLDESGTVTLANDQAEKAFTGFASGDWIGRPFAALVMEAVRNGTMPERSATRLLVTVEEQGEGKVLLSLPDNKFNEITVSSRQNRTVLLFEDISERVKAEERINFMAHYDALTGLPNRAYFTSQVEASLKQRSRARVRDMEMLMIIDVDDFKHVNDTVGHQLGDRLLIEVAQRMRQALGANTVIARLGGDEFVAYRSGVGSDQDAMAEASAVLSAFKTPMTILGHQVAPTVSIGIVTSRGDDDLDSLMTRADLALYKCKANGKAQSQIFHEEMDVAYRYRQRLKAELTTCVANGGLALAYQPIIDLKSRRVVGCEALARWHHAELGTIPPSVFIPIAEEIGLISEITRFVLNTATRECRNWPSDVRVSINISARDFRSGDVTGMVESALAASGLAPERLEVEVTETAVIEEREAATGILSALAAKGIGIALDDFGTGYSSLSYLQALPLTKLKIDRSFVIDIASNPRSMKLLSNVAQLGKDIDLTVTVEGVETDEQLALIAEHTRVDQIQGYLFGVPLSRRDIGELIARLAATARHAEKTGNKVNFA